jgi:glycosyltransferase involved in cell wall biosynthesis
MRILHVTTGLTTGGAEIMLLKLLSAHNGVWESAVVSLMDEGTIGSRIAALGIPVHSLGMRRGRPNPVRALSLISITRQFRPQLIQGWMYHGNLIASLASLSMHGRVPVLWNIRQSLYDIARERRLTRAMIRLGAFFSWHPANIIYNSQISARQHELFGFRTSKSVVIPNGFDSQLFRPDSEARHQIRRELGVGMDAILVGLIARFHSVKDHSGFLRSAALVTRVHPSVYFILAGSGVNEEEPTLRSLIAEHRLEGRTFLLGERSDIPKLTAALDIACSTSLGEGFSNAIGEAMACGVPCVVTDVGDSKVVVANTGLSVDPRDPEALAQAINHLIESGPEQRRQLGAAARQRIQTEFSLPAIARRYEDLYREHADPGLSANL